MDDKYTTMKEVRLQALEARGVSLDKDRDRSWSNDENEKEVLKKSKVIYVRDRVRVRKIPLQPKYLFAAA